MCVLGESGRCVDARFSLNTPEQELVDRFSCEDRKCIGGLGYQQMYEKRNINRRVYSTTSIIMCGILMVECRCVVVLIKLILFLPALG